MHTLLTASALLLGTTLGSVGSTHIYCSRQQGDEHPGILCCFQSSLFEYEISEQFEVVFTCSMYFSQKY